MTKEILIIGGKTTDPGESEMMARYSEYFIEGLEAVESHFIHFDELSIVVEPNRLDIHDHRHDRPLDSYDLIIFRGKIRANSELAYCVSRFCDVKGVKFFNDYTPYRPASKVSQAVTFFELNVRFTKTVYAMDHDILRSRIRQELTLPFILKDSYGSHGEDNYLVRSYEQLDEILHGSSAIRFIAQDYFPNDCDYRVLCIGKEELIIRRRAAGESHLNNTSQGGSAELVPASFFPATVVEEAHRIADFLRMGIAGVDVLFDEASSDFAFLEVNSQPQLSTGAFPAEKQAVVQRYLQSLLEEA